MLDILGKILADKILKCFFFFFQKIGFDIHAKLSRVSLGDSLYEMSKPVFFQKIREMSSACHLSL